MREATVIPFNGSWWGFGGTASHEGAPQHCVLCLLLVDLVLGHSKDLCKENCFVPGAMPRLIDAQDVGDSATWHIGGQVVDDLRGVFA